MRKNKSGDFLIRDVGSVPGSVLALEAARLESLNRNFDGFRRGPFLSRYTVLSHGGMRFLITDAPNVEEMDTYKALLAKHNVHHVVRVCEPTYDDEVFRGSDFKFHDWPSPDGVAPPADIIQMWLKLVNFVFPERRSSDSGDEVNTDCGETIAIHCRHGLGRAPVLVAVALIESGLESDEAVGLIRAKRRGAININQLQFLQQYVRTPKENPTAPKSGILSIARNALTRRSSTKIIRSRPASPVQRPLLN